MRRGITICGVHIIAEGNNEEELMLDELEARRLAKSCGNNPEEFRTALMNGSSNTSELKKALRRQGVFESDVRKDIEELTKLREEQGCKSEGDEDFVDITIDDDGEEVEEDEDEEDR